jgi:hypothetical protein
MNPLSVVLLGPPSSGKSSLLGALGQAAHSQPAALHAKLIDTSGELAKLGVTAKGGAVPPTTDEIAVYPIVLEDNTGHAEVVQLLDTSGVSDQALFGADVATAKGALPKAVAAADGILLLVDASSGSHELGRQFKQFVAFLRNFQLRRSAQTEVAGLPLFLVLTKCDRIAVHGESHAQWMQRVEAAKRTVADQLAKALVDAKDLAFGRLDLRVWATATRRPDVDGKVPPGSISRHSLPTNEPYQVAELFRQTFAAARDFRQRRERSYQRLHAAFMGLGALTFLLLAMLGWYALTQPTLDEAALMNQVQTLLAGGEESPAERVREPIEDRLKELEAVQHQPAFAHLPANIQKQVRDTEADIEAYRQLDREFRAKVRNPRLATRALELDDIEKSLATFDAPLAKWPDTRLAKRQQEWKDEIAAIRKGIAEEVAWTGKQFDEGKELLGEGGLVIAGRFDVSQRERWFARVNEYEVRGRRHKGNDRVAATSVPYRVIYAFDRVEQAERELRGMKEDLGRLYDTALRTRK